MIGCVLALSFRIVDSASGPGTIPNQESRLRIIKQIYRGSFRYYGVVLIVRVREKIFERICVEKENK